MSAYRTANTVHLIAAKGRSFRRDLDRSPVENVRNAPILLRFSNATNVRYCEEASFLYPPLVTSFESKKRKVLCALGSVRSVLLTINFKANRYYLYVFHLIGSNS